MSHPHSPLLSPAVSRSRRSYPNLHNLSLAPLSAKYSQDASPPSSPDESRTPTTSYIAQKSAPTTPGILSLSHTRGDTRQFSSNTYAYDSYFIHPEPDVRDAGDIPKAKSTSTLNPSAGVSGAIEEPRVAEKRHHTRKHTAPLPILTPMVKHHTKEANDEWIHRAGLAIAKQTRDRKGQGWLVRKESSTSLVQDSDNYQQHHDSRHMALLSGENADDFQLPSFISPRASRAGSRMQSRIHSRVPSARASRRGSRVGSRADLIMSVGSRPHSAHHSLDMSELHDRFIEPDFVQSQDESDGDEEEVARLARERGFGLGSWMDRLIGWTLFDVDEDGESSEEEEEDEEEHHGPLRLENLTKEELKLRREVEAKRRKMEREAIIASSALNGNEMRNGSTTGDESRPTTADTQNGQAATEEAGGWQDAAWLLSVASKALLS